MIYDGGEDDDIISGLKMFKVNEGASYNLCAYKYKVPFSFLFGFFFVDIGPKVILNKRFIKYIRKNGVTTKSEGQPSDAYF